MVIIPRRLSRFTFLDEQEDIVSLRRHSKRHHSFTDVWCHTLVIQGSYEISDPKSHIYTSQTNVEVTLLITRKARDMRLKSFTIGHDYVCKSAL